MVPQDQLQQQQQQHQPPQIVRPQMPGLIQIQSSESNEEGKNVIEISLD